MLFLALSIVVVPILIASCFSKTPTKVAIDENPKPEEAKPVKKEKKLNLIEVTATPKTDHQTSKIEILKPTTPNEDVKNPQHKKPDPTVLVMKTVSMDNNKEGKKPAPPAPPKPDSKKSSYAGMPEKSVPKPPTPKIASVITIPTTSTEPNKIQESPKNAAKKGSPLINDKTDDTIDDIPSVRVKEGVSYEGDGPPMMKSPDGQIQIQKKKSIEKSVETMKSLEGEKK